MKRIAGMPALASLCSAALLFPIFAARGQEAAAKAESSTNQQTGPVALSLRRAIELALQNSKDIQIAKLQSSLSQRSAQITRAEFMPNLYAGSGAGYTFGIPETPGGRAPSVFSVTYTEQVLNEPLRGQAKEQQEQARAQRIQLDEARNSVISRTAMAYLELAKVRHALQILQQEESSAERILQVTQEREQEGLELPVRVTEAKLTKARIAQRRLQVEGREDELETFLHGQTGIPEEQAIDVSPEELPGEAEQEGANLVALAMVNNTDVRMAQSDVRAKEFRLTGEKRGYWPTVELVSI
ncbi:MAG TPA: TolC family protein, partial [Candidatus Acidoferrum sp.]|nr:TolC family protein [Candidatus Acidoferrum sp.]